MNYEIGDVVILKSGSREMTANAWTDAPGNKDANETLFMECVWEEDGFFKKELFHPDALIKPV